MATATSRTAPSMSLRGRPATEAGKYNESGSPAKHAAQAGTEDQSTPVSGDGSALHAAPGSPAAPQAGAIEQSLPRDGRDGGRGGGGGGESRTRSRHRT